MADEFIKEVVDNYEEHELHLKLRAWDSKCSSCYKLCPVCMGEGIIYKDEWVGTDTSYEVEEKCVCQLD